VTNKIYSGTRAKKDEFFQKHSESVSLVTMETPDQKATLDGAILWSKPGDKKEFGDSQNKQLPPGKWIVRYLANGECYENNLPSNDNPSKELAKYKEAGFNVLLFNYRGIMDSTGYPKDIQNDLLTDGHTPVAFLKQLGVPITDITLVGESLGGGIATEVAARHPGVRLANLRSFASLSAAVGGLTYDFFGHNAISLGIAYIVRSIASGVLSQTNWEVHSHRAWKAVPLKDKWMVTASKDEVVTNMGKLYRAVVQEDPKYVRHLPKNSAERVQMKALIQRKLHAIKAHDLTHNKDLAEHPAFEEHLLYLQHTPEEVASTIKDPFNTSFTKKLELLNWLRADSPLLEVDTTFKELASQLADDATKMVLLSDAVEQERIRDMGYFIKAKLALAKMFSDSRLLGRALPQTQKEYFSAKENVQKFAKKRVDDLRYEYDRYEKLERENARKNLLKSI
jgi:pimeloyl-ACP methyl ester carboxylesterase